MNSVHTLLIVALSIVISCSNGSASASELKDSKPHSPTNTSVISPPPASLVHLKSERNSTNITMEAHHRIRRRAGQCLHNEKWPHRCKSDCDCVKCRYCSVHGWCHFRGDPNIADSGDHVPCDDNKGSEGRDSEEELTIPVY